MKKIKFIIIVLITGLIINSCGVIQQASELYNFSQCNFRLKTIHNIKLAGISIQNKKSFSDLSFAEAARLTQAVLSRDLPLSFTLQIEVKNPNKKTAALNRLDWILFIDNFEMTRGSTNQRVEIPPHNGTATLPLQLNFDLFEILSGETKDAILNFGFNLAGSGNTPTRITVKAKPTVYISGQEISYPGYVNIHSEYSSSKSNTNSQVGTIKL